MKYEFLEHTADVKFRAYGKNLEEVFKNSALALKETISCDNIIPKKQDKFSVIGDSLEDLLYNFLEEFLILFDEKGIIISEIKRIKIRKKKKGYSLKFSFLFDDCEEGNYEISNHIKAITFNDFFIKKENNKKEESWVAQIVVDV